MADITYHDHPVDNSPTASDEIPYWDVTDNGPKRATRAALLGAALTGGGSILTGGYTLTVPGTGTAVLANTAVLLAALRSNSQALNDDTAHSFIPAQDRGVVIVWTGASGEESGIYAYRVTATSNYCKLLVGGNVVAAATGALAGTTGTDANITVSAHTDGKIYLENRRGGARTLFWLVIA